MSFIKNLEYKWIVGIVFVFALFMDLLDITIVNVALPTFAKDFHAGTTGIEWVVTGYLVSLAIFIPVSGWAGDRFGTKRTFMFALIIFIIGSFLCSLAWNIQSLIMFRVLQGFGGGMLTPVGVAMLFRAFPPHERAQASAVLIVPTVVAPAAGPVLGGYLVQYHSWHWIFRINIPIGIVGLIAAWLLLREEKQPQTGRLDIRGFFLSASGLASFLYALSEAGNHGFTYHRVLIFGPAGIALLVIFGLLELRTKEPLIDMKLLANRLFRTSNAVQLVALAGLLGTLFLLPLLLQEERGITPLQSGLATFPQAVGVIMVALPASQLYRRFGPRRLLAVGMFGAVLTTLAFLLVNLQTNLWWIRFIMLARGLSFALVFISLQAAAFATIQHQDQGRASAIFNAGRQVGSSLGIAIVATVLSNRLIDHSAQLGNPLTQAGALTAFHDAFIAAAALTAIGIAASFFIRDKDAEVTMQKAKAPLICDIAESCGVQVVAPVAEPVFEPVVDPVAEQKSVKEDSLEDDSLQKLPRTTDGDEDI